MPSKPSAHADREMQIIDRLSKKYGRYALVMGVSKRASDLRDRVDSQLEQNDGALIIRAINEIARGRVQVKAGDPKADHR